MSGLLPQHSLAQNSVSRLRIRLFAVCPKGREVKLVSRNKVSALDGYRIFFSTDQGQYTNCLRQPRTGKRIIHFIKG
jgi:hypothetical protein